jgi:ArsR family transcriptional regulator
MTSLTQGAVLLRVLGDARRLRLLRLLLSQKELCVCELVDALKLPQYEVSRHLGALRKLGLVTDRREGLWAYYFISDTARQDPFIADLLKLVKERLKDPKQASADIMRLKERLGMRIDGECVVGFRE